jgi:hypothetical protein
MVKYLVVHNKHEGCYDFQFYQDEVARIRLTSITINPPKIYMFNTRDEAQDFFEEYINDVDCIDIRCKRGDDVEHIEYCTCGVIELDEEENPILFYNRKNQIFLLEHGPQLFVPPAELKNDIKNLNLTNRLIRKCRTLSREQRNRYIELGKYCQDCNSDEPEDTETKNEVVKNSSESKREDDKQNNSSKPVSVIQVTIPASSLTPTPVQLTSPPIQFNLSQLQAQAQMHQIHQPQQTVVEEKKKPKTVKKKKETEETPNNEQSSDNVVKKTKVTKKKKSDNDS